MEKNLRDCIRKRVELLLDLFEQQSEVLSVYKYVDTDLIEEVWDKQIKILSKYMGMSEETYNLVLDFFLDGHIGKINTIDELINCIIKRNAE